MALLLVLIAVVVFIIAYIVYGGWLCKKLGIDPERKTPAHELRDGVDYVPAKAPVVLGHHFSSIAGAGPITGPIAAAMFGWLPVYLWILIGSIFVGGVHDMTALFASVRNDGKSIGAVIEETIGETGKQLFSIFAWLTLILVEAAFIAIVVGTFVATPAVATTSLLFIIIAILFGFMTNKMNVKGSIATIIGLVLILVALWVGPKAGIVLSSGWWTAIIALYIFVASITPVWILLQPRDYLSSFLLYAMLAGAFVGLVIFMPEINREAVTSFAPVQGSWLFPILFVTVACGAISGFHSLVSSGTTSKQVTNEKDIKLIGYGSMLIEGVLAVIALISVSFVATKVAPEGASSATLFAYGVGEFMTSFGLPFETGVVFISLAVSTFALTSLDTATRLARFIFQEYFEGKDETETTSIAKVLSNRYVATLISVSCGVALCLAGWKAVWPIFGSANQLLAALALLAVGTWLKKEGKENRYVTIPMMFMVAVTLCALVLLIYSKAMAGAWLLVVIAVLLFILAIIFIKHAFKYLGKGSI